MVRTAQTEFLGSMVGETGIGIATAMVQEVFEARSVTRVPGCPRFVAGMVNIRGEAVPVLDLFGVGIARGAVSKIVVLRTGEGQAGLVISRLVDLLRFDSVEPCTVVPDGLAAYSPAFLLRGRRDDGMFFIMDVDTAIRLTLPESQPRGNVE